MRAEIARAPWGARVARSSRSTAREVHAPQAGALRRGRAMMEAEIRAIPAASTRREHGLLRRQEPRLALHHPREDHRRRDRITFDYSDTDRRPTASSTAPTPRAPRPRSSPCLQMVTRHPAQPRHDRAPRDHHPRGDDPQRRLPEGHHLRNHLCPPNADAIIRALAPVIPERVTRVGTSSSAHWTTGRDPRKQTRSSTSSSWPEGRLRRHGRGRRLRPHRHDRRLGGVLDQTTRCSSR